ncbi:membrane protein [Corynebacterium phocae]|uniref:Membrane protein n=1 Tax=Corynebacterium phocae TaxID=161895 RepID=A0A1L7D640_9CORY|nr:hypothetical protein [Corynebacterium phocae]APT93402.1 membrane protein [Corynebacterium phocae]KAA8721097.1 hypothetical protein F4V58_10945 [Corynebacterium phocae]
MSKLAEYRNPRVAGPYVVAAVVGILAFWGGWTRRWMSDDGLIVLRTVRNLIAGNGPVFNIGERVEANTSTLWQYLIYATQRLTGAQLESISLALALGLSVAALALGSWATARIYTAVTVPAGALIYLALPPARDFMTSGLEWGLSIFYLAVLWALLLAWARAEGQRFELWLAFWCGVSWLVRPELALYGGIVGLMLLLTGNRRLAVLGVALPLPAGYQIFRMGYYGLLTPHTAVAKSASDSAWGQGMHYVLNLVGPYWLWLPLLLIAVAGGWALRLHAQRSVLTVSILMLVAAGLHTLYVIRVGGDFMHGRMLLLPLFAALLPVLVLPLSRARAFLACAAVIIAWALVVVARGNNSDWALFQGKVTVVDEREFWTYATQRDPGDGPLYADDFRDAQVLNGFEPALGELRNGEAVALRYLEDRETGTFSWLTVSREPGLQGPPSLYFINMGMSSAFSPLDIRVLDNIGLATPMAARQPRIEGGRIGHDKLLSREWQVADTAVDIDQLPPWIDHDKAKLCRKALETPVFQELFATYRAPLTPARFVDNILWSLNEGRTLELSSDPREYLN